MDGGDQEGRQGKDWDLDFCTIPFQDRYILYRPRRHLAFIGNQALVDHVRNRRAGRPGPAHPEADRFLASAGFWAADLECTPLPPAEDIRPTQAVLLMTNHCNLRCVYCYANAGAESRSVQMPWPVAQAVIDTMLANARRPGAASPALTFHGGGEPTVHWETLVRATQYAKNGDARTRVSMSSNGVWSDRQRKFICQHFDNVSLSMDGIAPVQDRQRPRRNGGGSYQAVMESIAALDEAGIDYGIRMTVLPDVVGHLAEGVRLICEKTRARAIQIEPTFTSSRGQYADITGEFADAFADRFLEAWKLARSAGRHIYYSGARPWVIAPMFCMAPLQAMVATADGRLVTCFEVFSEQSPMAGLFTVGRVSGGRVTYDRAALRRFVAAQQRRREACRDCFCYWHCCGDCATRRPDGHAATQGRCRATRKITLGLLLDYIEEGGGVWQGLREQRLVSAEVCSGESGPAATPATDARKKPAP